MTKRKDLKRRVRARQEKTGESYTAALSNIRPTVHIPEAPSATAEARAAGLRCEAVVSEELRRMGDLEPLFVRLRELLLALAAEACRPLIHGEALAPHMPDMKDAVEARRFFEAVRAGERGLSRNGRMVAFNWRERVVVVDLALAGARKPLLQVGVLGEGPLWPAELLMMGVGR